MSNQTSYTGNLGTAKSQSTVRSRNYRPSLPDEAVAPPVQCKTYAVIGTTGFVGPYIVASLLKVEDRCKVVCINRKEEGKTFTLSALRNMGGESAIARSNIRFLTTDMWKKNLGLTRREVEMLASEVDEVIFSAWNPHWGLPLKSFRPLLDAVHNTIEFCNSSPRKPRITFVSSICAVGEWYRKHPNRPLIPEVVAWDKASAMSNGYSESKFEAEKILSDAHAKLGLRVTIIRPGQIGGPAMSSTIRKAWPEQGWLRSVITTSEKIGYWPAHIQPLDWIPVDVLSEGIANTTRCESNYGGMQVFNMLHPNPAPWSLLFTTLRDEFGLSAKEVTLPEWLDKLEPKKLKIHGFLRTFGSGREYNMPFENRKALTMLPKVAPITKEHLVVWMKGWDLKQNESKAQL